MEESEFNKQLKSLQKIITKQTSMIEDNKKLRGQVMARLLKCEEKVQELLEKVMQLEIPSWSTEDQQTNKTCASDGFTDEGSSEEEEEEKEEEEEAD